MHIYVNIKSSNFPNTCIYIYIPLTNFFIIYRLVDWVHPADILTADQCACACAQRVGQLYPTCDKPAHHPVRAPRLLIGYGVQFGRRQPIENSELVPSYHHTVVTTNQN